LSNSAPDSLASLSCSAWWFFDGDAGSAMFFFDATSFSSSLAAV